MRKIVLLFLCLAALVQATTYYVTADAAGGGAGSQVSPWTIQEAFNSLVGGSLADGDIVYVKAGNHTMSANVVGTNDGSNVAHIKFIATDASWNAYTPTRSAVTKRFDFSSWGYINTNGYYLNLDGSRYVDMINLYIYGSVNGYLIRCGYNNIFYGCKIVNNYNGANAVALQLYENYSSVLLCEIYSSSSSSNYSLQYFASYCRVIGCIFPGSSITSVQMSYANNLLANSIVYGFSTYGVKLGSNAGYFANLVLSCTIDGGGSGTKYGIWGDAYDYTYEQFAISNIISGCTYPIYCAGSSVGSQLISLSNRFYNNTHATSWLGQIFEYGNNSTATSDFRDSGSADYRLDILAPALNAGVLGNSMGALGPEDIPSKSNVYSIDTVMGETGTLTLPTAAQVLYNVLFGPDSGTQGNFYVPAEADVKAGVTYGNDNTQYTGEYVGTSGTGGKKPASTGGGFQ